MTIEELKEHITVLPEQLRQALTREAEARFRANRLEDSVEELREKLKNEGADEDDNEPEEDDGDDDIEIIKLESELERLKVKLDAAKDKAEIDFRRENLKATNEHVKAAVGNNPDVGRLNLELINAKEECKIKKMTLQRARREARDTRLEARRRDLFQRRQGKPEPESEELDKLEEQHSEAIREVMEAKVEVEFLKTKLDTFKLLIQLESIG